MATTTIDSARFDTPRERSFWGRVFDRIAEAQMQKARAMVRPHLLALDNEELALVGYTREEIGRW
jgi:hypothetical protein